MNVPILLCLNLYLNSSHGYSLTSPLLISVAMLQNLAFTNRTLGWLVANTVTLAISSYIYFVVRSKPIGHKRLLYSLPVFPINLLLPCIFDPSEYLIGTGILFCCISWLASFRLLTFCWGLGPASDPWIISNLFRFHAALSLPIHIQPMCKSEKGNPGKKQTSNKWLSYSILVSYLGSSENFAALALRFVFKSFILSLILKHYDTWKHSHILISEYILSFCIYLFVTIVCEFVAAISTGLFGVKVESHFDQPYISSSLEEFWARRWNIMVSSNLRETIYLPTINFLCPLFKIARAETHPKKDSNFDTNSHSNGSSNDSPNPISLKPTPTENKKFRVRSRRKNGQVFTEEVEINPSVYLCIRLSAMFASFFVSGIAHEILFFYVTYKMKEEITGEITAFFIVHGIATASEVVWRRRCSSSNGVFKLPKIFRIFLTTGFALVTADYLFFAPFHRRGIFPMIISGMKSTIPF